MHNAKTVLPGAEVPLVVKFADARKKDGFANGIKRGILPDPWQDNKRQLGGGMPDAFLQVSFGQTEALSSCCPPPFHAVLQFYQTAVASSFFLSYSHLVSSYTKGPIDQDKFQHSTDNNDCNIFL